MLGRICLTGFVGLMALGASCEDTRSFSYSSMKFDFVFMAKCLDPRKIDLRRGFDETCSTISKMVDFKSTFYRPSSQSSQNRNFFTGQAQTHTRTFASIPAIPRAQTTSYSSGARVIHMQ